MLGCFMGTGMALELHSGAEGVWKKFQMTHFDMPNNVSSIKYALKSVPGFADVGVPHGDGMAPELRPWGLDKKCTHTTLISMKN